MLLDKILKRKCTLLMAKKQFKAESKRLLDLMVNSIYTHKEIFLREIISNASDACDKLCYLALTENSVGMDRKDFVISLTANKAERTLTVSDNGIGMDKEDLENNLGVIASSGSFKFKQEADQGIPHPIQKIHSFTPLPLMRLFFGMHCTPKGGF